MSNLISNSENLVLEESEWIRHGPDLAALGKGGDHGWLNTAIEELLNGVSRTFTKVSPNSCPVVSTKDYSDDLHRNDFWQ